MSGVQGNCLEEQALSSVELADLVAVDPFLGKVVEALEPGDEARELPFEGNGVISGECAPLHRHGVFP